METGRLRFDRNELAGGLGDLGTLLPLALALVALNGLSFTTVFLVTGLAYVATGLFYGIPVPVQPLKLVTAVAIAAPERFGPAMFSAVGLLMGVILLVLAATGAIDALARLFTRPIVRGIQLGLGLILTVKAVDLLSARSLFLGPGAEPVRVAGVAVNPLLGVAAAAAVFLLLGNRRFPAALVLVGLGILAGAAFGAFRGFELRAGPAPLRVEWPGAGDLADALVLLVIPQLPMTLGNAIIGSTDAARRLLGEGRALRRVTNRNYAVSIGLANLASGAVSGMPLCHGAGGLAAHVRFGARTGGATVMIGGILVALALGLGKVGLALVGALPAAVLGVLLLFAGLELGLLVRDVREKRDLLVTLLIAGLAVATRNMGLAFGAGIAASLLLRWTRAEV